MGFRLVTTTTTKESGGNGHANENLPLLIPQKIKGEKKLTARLVPPGCKVKVIKQPADNDDDEFHQHDASNDDSRSFFCFVFARTLNWLVPPPPYIVPGGSL